MGLNIKNERVHSLAREAARVTGKSQTSAIEEALQLLLRDHGEDPERVRLQDRKREVREIVDAYAKLPPAPRGADETAEVEDLYDDELGLPR